MFWPIFLETVGKNVRIDVRVASGTDADQERDRTLRELLDFSAVEYLNATTAAAHTKRAVERTSATSGF